MQDHGPERLFELTTIRPPRSAESLFNEYVGVLSDYDQRISSRLVEIETLLVEVQEDYYGYIDPNLISVEGVSSTRVWSDVHASLFVEGVCPNVGTPWSCSEDPECCENDPDCCPQCGVMHLTEIPAGGEIEFNGEYFLTTITGPEGTAKAGHSHTSVVTKYSGIDISGIPIIPSSSRPIEPMTEGLCLTECTNIMYAERSTCTYRFLGGLGVTFASMAWSAGAGAALGGPVGSVGGIVWAGVVGGGATNYRYYTCLRDVRRRKNACDLACRA